jgi:hypothetical protein
MEVLTKRCGYRRNFTDIGFSKASWPLARISISDKCIVIESLVEKIEIGPSEVVDVRRELFGTRLYLVRHGESEDIALYGWGLNSELATWWEGQK